MSQDEFSQLKNNLLSLPEVDRAALAHLLWESLDSSSNFVEEEEKDILQEVRRRSEELLTGKMLGLQILAVKHHSRHPDYWKKRQPLQ